MNNTLSDLFFNYFDIGVHLVDDFDVTLEARALNAAEQFIKDYTSILNCEIPTPAALASDYLARL